MGQSKLLLPWPTHDRPDGTVIDSVLNAWTSSCVQQVIVIVRDDDQPLANACANWPVTVLQPLIAPADMKASVQVGVRFLEEQFAPEMTHRCFAAPADLPTLTDDVINRLAEAPSDPEHIVVPMFGARQGHPTLIPWLMMQEVFQLREDQGIDQIVNKHRRLNVFFPQSAVVQDVDTPGGYRGALIAAKMMNGHDTR